MITSIQQRHTTLAYRVFSAFIAFTFIFSSIVPPQRAYAQTVLNLPSPGTMVPLSPIFNPRIVSLPCNAWGVALFSELFIFWYNAT